MKISFDLGIFYYKLCKRKVIFLIKVPTWLFFLIVPPSRSSTFPPLISPSTWSSDSSLLILLSRSDPRLRWLWLACAKACRAPWWLECPIWLCPIPWDRPCWIKSSASPLSRSPLLPPPLDNGQLRPVSEQFSEPEFPERSYKVIDIVTFLILVNLHLKNNTESNIWFITFFFTT